jgi:hypothetical protein
MGISARKVSFLVEQATKKMKKEENNDLSRLTQWKTFYQLTFKYGFSILTGKNTFLWYRENYRGLFESFECMRDGSGILYFLS